MSLSVLVLQCESREKAIGMPWAVPPMTWHLNADFFGGLFAGFQIQFIDLINGIGSLCAS
jgi:hypothetical protein